MAIKVGVVLYLFLMRSLLEYVLQMYDFHFVFFDVFSCHANGILKREGVERGD